MHPIARNRGKEPVIPDDIGTLADDELSSSNSPSLSLCHTPNSTGVISVTILPPDFFFSQLESKLHLE